MERVKMGKEVVSVEECQMKSFGKNESSTSSHL